MVRLTAFFLSIFLLNSLKASTQLVFKEKLPGEAKKGINPVLPQNFYIQHLGFFCKKEWQLQKITSTNIFIRLGDKDYVDKIEKHGF